MHGRSPNARVIRAEDEISLQLQSAFAQLGGSPWLGRARFLEVKDRQYLARRDHLQGAFGFTPFREINSHNLLGLSQQDETFDILIISVDDIGRLRSIFHAPADLLLTRKLSFAVSSAPRPSERAKLLRMGFDDVFSCQMDVEEIVLRVAAIYNRKATYDSLRDDLYSEEFSHFCSKNLNTSLGGKQKDLLWRLYQAKGRTVTFRQLATYDIIDEKFRINSLKVRITALRKKLINCSICSDRGSGFYLTFNKN